MTKEKIQKALEECQRFMVKASAALHDFDQNRCVAYSGSKATGACRRASMDLTRALAELRRP